MSTNTKVGPHNTIRKSVKDVLNVLAVCNVLFEYTGNNPTYIGYALPGIATTATGWLIFKNTFDGSGNITTKYAANGQLEFDKKWSDRATYTYSADGS